MDMPDPLTTLTPFAVTVSRPERLFPKLPPAQLSDSRRTADDERHRAARCWLTSATGSCRVKTGPDLSSEELAAAKWPDRRSPFLLETNRPGIFAVGDVRGGNVKRVASAVGEGSIAVALVHQVLRS